MTASSTVGCALALVVCGSAAPVQRPAGIGKPVRLSCKRTCPRTSLRSAMRTAIGNGWPLLQRRQIALPPDLTTCACHANIRYGKNMPAPIAPGGRE